ncbi:MAG: YdcF family protein [Clostridia bacterium]|nr:YdcF family protein [Clostridia bacterium]
MSKFALPKHKGARMLLCVLAVLCLVGLLGILAIGIVNGVVMREASDRILPMPEAAALEDIDYILVLGAGVKADGTPSDMLHDRVLTAVNLRTAGQGAPLLMSGDNQHVDYDEVSAMVALAVELGEVEDTVNTDRLGLSTYESVTRAAELYGAKRVVIVTQEYHLYRALYIAEQMGLDAYGVSADVRSYWGQAMREVREVAARCKDFLLLQFD